MPQRHSAGGGVCGLDHRFHGLTIAQLRGELKNRAVPSNDTARLNARIMVHTDVVAIETGELGKFLRARRGGVRPQDVGLPAGVRMRRTPGLRREELAALAGVSIDYYARLEQGKETNPSVSVLDALAGALLLDDDAHAHLYAIANQAAGRTLPARRLAGRSVRPAIELLIEQLRPVPGVCPQPHQRRARRQH